MFARVVLTDKETALLRQWWGVRTLKRIAQDLGVSVPTVRNLGRRLNLPKLPRGGQSTWTAELDRKLKKLYPREDLSIEEIGDTLGYSIETVKKRAARLGLKRKRKKRAVAPKAVKPTRAAVPAPAAPRAVPVVRKRRWQDMPEGDEKFVACMLAHGWGTRYNPQAVAP